MITLSVIACLTLSVVVVSIAKETIDAFKTLQSAANNSEFLHDWLVVDYDRTKHW
jgi:hypothetical protein